MVETREVVLDVIRLMLEDVDFDASKFQKGRLKAWDVPEFVWTSCIHDKLDIGSHLSKACMESQPRAFKWDQTYVACPYTSKVWAGSRCVFYLVLFDLLTIYSNVFSQSTLITWKPLKSNNIWTIKGNRKELLTSPHIRTPWLAYTSVDIPIKILSNES